MAQGAVVDPAGVRGDRGGLADLAARVAADGAVGARLGIRAGQAQVVDAAIPHGLSAQERAEATAVALGGPDSARNAAVARAAAVQGKPFLARYGQLGLQLASSQKPDRVAVQMGHVAAASTEELQAVLRVGGKRLKDFGDREVAMRVDQMVLNKPKVLQNRMALDPTKSKEEHMEILRKEADKWDHVKLRDHSKKDGADLMLPVNERVTVASLHRGYDAIAGVLQSRGLTPEVSKKGTEATKAPSVAQSMAGSQVRTAPLRRGGLDLG